MANEQSKRSSKRRVKSPETFRERASKSAEASQQVARSKRVRGAVGTRLGKIFAPVGRPFKRLGRVSALRWLGKAFRFIGLILFPRYFRNSWRELRQVSWPSWKQSRRLTFAVLAFALVFGAAIALVDYGLDKVFKQVLLK